MAIYVQCPNPKCRRRNSRKNLQCRKCGTKLSRLTRYYWIEYRLPDGTRKLEALGRVDLDYAMEIEERRKNQVRAGHYGTPATSESKLTWLQVRLTYCRKLESEGANANYQNDTRRYLREMGKSWGDKRLVHQITPVMIRECRMELLERGISKATCDRWLAAGKAAFRYAAEDLPNPFTKVKLFRPDNTVTRFLSTEQREALLEAAKSISRHLHEIIQIALTTGLRKSNILNLRRDQVDFQAGTISVIQKGNRPITIPLNDAAREVLEAIPDNDSPFFWISSRSGQPYTVYWRKPWDKAKELAEIPEEFRFHDLRHDAGTQIYDTTHDLRMTAKLLGHSQTKTTERYAHVMPDYLREASEAMSKGIRIKKRKKKQQ